MDNSVIVFSRIKNYLSYSPFTFLNFDLDKLNLYYKEFSINIKEEKVYVTFSDNISLTDRTLLENGLNIFMDGIIYA